MVGLKMVQTSTLTLLLLVDSSEALLNIIHVAFILLTQCVCVCMCVCVCICMCVWCVCLSVCACIINTGLSLPPSWKDFS